MESEGRKELKSGFTFTSGLAVIYALFIFVPALLYLQLMVGTGGIPVAWFTVVLFVELGRLLGHKVTKQEATMIFILSSAVLFIPTGLVYRGYFRTSEIAQLFGIAEEIPTWYAPDPATGVYEMRTFFHSAWITPLAIYFVEIIVVSVGIWGLAFFARRLYIEEENLPFPMQQVSASAIMTLVEEAEEYLERTRLLFLVALIGFVYGFIVYAAPFMVKAYAAVTLTLIPVPWFDLTPIVERFLPGALLGIATDLGPIAAAFVLPIPTILSIIVGSFAIYFFGNWLSVTYDIAVRPWYTPGMPVQLALQRCTLYLWGIPIMGIGLAGGFIPVMIRYLRRIGRTSSISKGSTRRIIGETFSLKKWFLPPLFVIFGFSIFLYLWLAPNFPLWLILPFVLAVPIALVLIDGRMLGETGITFAAGQTQNVMRLVYLASGYRGVDVWFIPTPWRSGAAGTLSNLKVCDLTETSVRSFLKMWWIFLPFGVLSGLIFMQLFWTLAPIPSGRYPGAEIFWPIQAVNTSLWIAGLQAGLFRTEWLAASFLIGSGLAAAFELTGLNALIPFVGIVAGTVTFTPFAVTYGLGLVLRMIFWRISGKQWVEDRKQLLAAGLIMGQGIAVLVSISLVLIINSIWILPY